MDGPKVALHALASHHIPAILAACADWEELSAFGPPYWRPRSEAELTRKIAATAGPTPATEYSFVASLPDGRLVGECSIHGIDWRSRHAQVGVCIWQPGDRRRGHGRASVRFATAWAQNHLGLRRLEAWIIDGNNGSRALFGGLGWSHEATLRSRYLHGGVYRDVHVLSRDGGAAASRPQDLQARR